MIFCFTLIRKIPQQSVSWCPGTPGEPPPAPLAPFPLPGTRPPQPGDPRVLFRVLSSCCPFVRPAAMLFCLCAVPTSAADVR
ncbi:unnamed protein product [Gadus morhua 'NCC']